MPAPNVVTYDPAANAVNVALNKVIKVTFDTTLAPATVSPANFALRHAGSKMPIRVTVELDSTSTIAIITPATLLFKNSSFTLRIVGANSGLPTGNLEASDGSDFATTTEITFTTGDDIEVTDDQKTNVQQAAEGDIRLPGSVKVTSLAKFQVVKTTPNNHSYNFTGSTIKIEFNRNVSSPSTTGNIIVNQAPFLDEQGWIARSGVATTGNWYFEWDKSAWSGEAGDFFALPTWAITTSGKVVTLSATGQNYTGNTFKNVRYEVNVDDLVTDTSGNYLNKDVTIHFTSMSWPNYVTPKTIRNEVYTIFDSLNLDFVHELVWKKMIEAFRLVGGNKNQFTSNGFYIRKYVTYGVTLDIVRDLFINKAILAGISKTLGDFIITYHPTAGDISKNNVINAIEKKFKQAERAINYRAHTARVFMRGVNSGLDPINFRTRLWKNPGEDYNNDGLPQASNWPVANTTSERWAKIPGNSDEWS